MDLLQGTHFQDWPFPLVSTPDAWTVSVLNSTNKTGFTYLDHFCLGFATWSKHSISTVVNHWICHSNSGWRWFRAVWDRGYNNILLLKGKKWQKIYHLYHLLYNMWYFINLVFRWKNWLLDWGMSAGRQTLTISSVPNSSYISPGILTKLSQKICHQVPWHSHISVFCDSNIFDGIMALCFF